VSSRVPRLTPATFLAFCQPIFYVPPPLFQVLLEVFVVAFVVVAVEPEASELVFAVA